MVDDSPSRPANPTDVALQALLQGSGRTRAVLREVGIIAVRVREAGREPFELHRAVDGDACLPPTTLPVPRSLSEVRAWPFESIPSDWQTGGWERLQYRPEGPIFAQYQWIRHEPTRGEVVAVIDADANGRADSYARITIACRRHPEGHFVYEMGEIETGSGAPG